MYTRVRDEPAETTSEAGVWSLEVGQQPAGSSEGGDPLCNMGE
jgi:hypothetical protein